MQKNFTQTFFFYFLLFCRITFSSDQIYDEKVINFLNSLKDIEPKAQNLPGYVYKMSSKENEGLTSILFGTEHYSESFCKISELPSLADIFYFESTVPKKYIVPKEGFEKIEKMLDTKIQRVIEKENKTLKFLDNMVGEEFWDEVLANVKKRHENLQVSHVADENYLHYMENIINLTQVVATMDEIEMTAYSYYDLETAKKSDEMKKKLMSKKFYQIENEYNEIAINQRNKKWIKIEELLQDLKTKNVFIAIGYAHLLGHGTPEFGLIELLKKENFKVEHVSLSELGLTKSFDNEESYYDQVRKTKNKIFDLCRPVFHVKTAKKFIKPITLEDLQGNWLTSFSDAVMFTVKDKIVTMQGNETVMKIEEMEEDFSFESLLLNKKSETLTWTDGETSMYWYRPPDESDILVQINGLKNSTKYNEKFGVVTKLLFGEENRFGVLVDGYPDSIIKVKKENVVFVQNVPEIEDLTLKMDKILMSENL